MKQKEEKKMQNKTRFIKDILWFFVFWGVIIAIFRMWFGLGATTNLSDEVPWGLWKILNMIAGVALSTCGFTVGFLAYVLKIEKFKPLVKPAILVAFLGYGSSCAALMFDIGLPQNFWHPFVMWNEHSFLFEVFWCVIIYFTVTFIELIPNILERFKAEKTVKFLHKISVGVVILGISLSSLHHSSLGSLFLTTPLKLHALWYTPMIPWMFIISAMGGGMMFLVLVKILYSRLYKPESVFGMGFYDKSSNSCLIDTMPKMPKVYGKEMPMLSSLSVIAASLLGLYLLIKIYDLFASGSINALMAGTWESWLYSVELILTAVIPILLVAINRTRKSPYGLAFASASASFGVVLNRVDVGIFGYVRDAGTVYLPSLGEWALSIGVVAGAALALIYIAENFSIFDDEWEVKKKNRNQFNGSFDTFSHVLTSALQDGVHRISIIGVFTLPIAFILLYPYDYDDDSALVSPAIGVDQGRTVLLINGNANDMSTKFPHEAHKQRLGGDESCITCHHMAMPNDNSTPCARCHRSMLNETKIFDHNNHLTSVSKMKNLGGLHPENKTCQECHTSNEAKSAANAKACLKCHSEDMNIQNQSKLSGSIKYASSYMDAMHKNCIPCHSQQEKLVGKQLSNCNSCHKDRIPKTKIEIISSK
jgi:Ni/Fe-hydrogenase subunit HybB-like protein